MLAPPRESKFGLRDFDARAHRGRRARAHGPGRTGADTLNLAVAPRLLWVSSIFALALFACSPATDGLGEAGVGEDESEAAGAGASLGGGESSEAGASSEDTDDAPGDGDPTQDTDGDEPTDTDDPPDTDDSAEAGFECGDGSVGPGEECDGADFGGETCVSLGFLGGPLGCGPSCGFDTSGCEMAVCGNGVVEGDEECDGDAFNAQDCVTLGFQSGGLSCDDSSCEFNTIACEVPGVGDSCGLFNPPCPSPLLYCYIGTCYDGSEGDPCLVSNDKCKPGLKCTFKLSGTSCTA